MPEKLIELQTVFTLIRGYFYKPRFKPQRFVWNSSFSFVSLRYFSWTRAAIFIHLMDFSLHNTFIFSIDIVKPCHAE